MIDPTEERDPHYPTKSGRETFAINAADETLLPVTVDYFVTYAKEPYCFVRIIEKSDLEYSDFYWDLKEALVDLLGKIDEFKFYTL